MPALPPPLPIRLPPKLPGRSSPPPLPGMGRGGPPPLPGQRKEVVSFDRDAQARYDRDREQTGGKIYHIWISVDSQNVNRVRCDPEYDFDGQKTGRGLITIEFLNLSMYEYPDRTLGDFSDILESSSKGRFVYFRVRGPGRSKKGMGIWTFKKLRGPMRAVTKAMLKSRKPRTKAQAKRTFTVAGQRGAFGKGGRRIKPPPLPRRNP